MTATPPAPSNSAPRADSAAPPAATPPTGTPRWVWLMLILLAAALVAGVAGVLAHAGGATVPNAILTSGAAFAGAVLLLLALAHFLSGGR